MEGCDWRDVAVVALLIGYNPRALLTSSRSSEATVALDVRVGRWTVVVRHQTLSLFRLRVARASVAVGTQLDVVERRALRSSLDGQTRLDDVMEFL